MTDEYQKYKIILELATLVTNTKDYITLCTFMGYDPDRIELDYSSNGGQFFPAVLEHLINCALKKTGFGRFTPAKIVFGQMWNYFKKIRKEHEVEAILKRENVPFTEPANGIIYSGQRKPPTPGNKYLLGLAGLIQTFDEYITVFFFLNNLEGTGADMTMLILTQWLFYNRDPFFASWSTLQFLKQRASEEGNMPFTCFNYIAAFQKIGVGAQAAQLIFSS